MVREFSAVLTTGEIERDSPRILNFEIKGLFGSSAHHKINFPEPKPNNPSASILIMAGRNGSGKTTILNMIAGMLQLNFDEFRRIPFQFANLQFSDQRTLTVQRVPNDELPLLVTWEDFSVPLAKSRANPSYSQAHTQLISEFRESAKPVVDSINFELLSIHRSRALQDNNEDEEKVIYTASGRPVRESRGPSLAIRVKRFIREAQLNYRRYFSGEEVALLPRMLKRLKLVSNVTSQELLERVAQLKFRSEKTSRFGLQTDSLDLDSLSAIIQDHLNYDSNALLILETYVELQESRQDARDKISDRLWKFEQILDDFLVNKTVRINAQNGLTIQTDAGDEIPETSLSSGEYHFLYMMVSALLCQSTGSIIAIDEPELSLHVKWQRKILGALSECSFGAAPLFLFATHSMPIVAEHENSIYELSPLE